VNGRFVTLDARSSIADAAAVTEGRFVAIGTVVEVNQLIAPATRVIDLEGRTVVRGFIDGHAHMDREGLKFLLLSLHGVRSIEDILDTIEREVRKKQPGEWIVTMPIGDYPEFGGAPGLLAENMYPTASFPDRHQEGCSGRTYGRVRGDRPHRNGGVHADASRAPVQS